MTRACFACSVCGLSRDYGALVRAQIDAGYDSEIAKGRTPEDAAAYVTETLVKSSAATAAAFGGTLVGVMHAH